MNLWYYVTRAAGPLIYLFKYDKILNLFYAKNGKYRLEDMAKNK
nr:MAG TPA: hypothetical protein [Caudoviricetes sp.]